MAKMKIVIECRKTLSGHSLIEVIVSTVIILIVFLLFSTLLGQVFSSRKILAESIMLYKISTFHSERSFDDSLTIRKFYGDSRIEFSKAVINDVECLRVYTKSNDNGAILFQDVLFNDSSANLYSD